MEESIENTIQKCQEEIASIENLQEKQEQRERIRDLWKKYKGEDEVISSKEYQKIIALQDKTNQLKVMTDIPKLDDIIGGFREGNLVVISGATGMGKTSVAQSLTENFDEKTLWFSYEVPVAEFMTKFREAPLFYLPKSIIGDTVSWVENKIVESMAKFDTRVVFIDHLHYIVDIASLKANISVQIGVVMRELKKIALKWGIIIFLIAHLKKTKITDVPEIDDMRDSSFIAQEADIVMVVTRLKQEDSSEFSNEALVSVLKHRRTGKTGTVKLLYHNHRFNQVANEYDK